MSRKKEERRTGNEKDRAVKIDSELFGKIFEFIAKKENKMKYSSIKQFIDNAVLDKLAEEEGIEEKSINMPKPNSNIFAIKKEAKTPIGII